VEYGRIHGLDIRSVLFEDRSRTFRRDFLIFEIDREIYRARRYHSALSLALLEVGSIEGGPDVRDDVDRSRVQMEIYEQMAATLRDLDVVSAVEDTWVAVLLPETPLEAAVNVGQRLCRVVSDYQSISVEEPVSVTAAVGELLADHETGMEFFDYVHRIFMWVLKERPGTVVSAETWKTEGRNA
jgi:GGDEF domain-containing protein